MKFNLIIKIFSYLFFGGLVICNTTIAQNMEWSNALSFGNSDFDKGYCVTVDNMSNALFLALKYENIEGVEITIPSRTYPSVPCEILHAGGKVKFKKVKGKKLKGPYQLEGSKVWDSALRFTADMYKDNTHMCVSFTEPTNTLNYQKVGLY